MSAAKKKSVSIRTDKKIKVLIADDDGQTSRRLADFLVQNGFDARTAVDGPEARKIIFNWVPHFVLCDLMLPDGNAFALMRFINEEASLKNKEIKFCIMSGHNNPLNVKEAFRRGAKDYWVRPMDFHDLLSRLVLLCREHRALTPAPTDLKKLADASHLLHLLDLLLAQALAPDSIEDILFNLTKMAAVKSGGVRCSVVRKVTIQQGFVVASSDDRNASGIKLDLNKYPEIQLVVNSGQMMAIDNIDSSRKLAPIKRQFRNINFNSIVVCPVFFNDKIFGVISMRMPPKKKNLTDDEIRFVEVVSRVVSLALSRQNVSDISHFGLTSVEAKNK